MNTKHLYEQCMMHSVNVQLDKCGPVFVFVCLEKQFCFLLCALNKKASLKRLDSGPAQRLA